MRDQYKLFRDAIMGWWKDAVVVFKASDLKNRSMLAMVSNRMLRILLFKETRSLGRLSIRDSRPWHVYDFMALHTLFFVRCILSTCKAMQQNTAVALVTRSQSRGRARKILYTVLWSFSTHNPVERTVTLIYMCIYQAEFNQQPFFFKSLSKISNEKN